MSINEETKTTNTRGVGPVTITTTAAAAATTIAMWILGLYEVNPPPEVQGAITALIVFFAGLIVPSKRGKRVA